MDLNFRPIREDSVMCTIQGCVHTAAFILSGGIDTRTGGRSFVAAYCENHAREEAARLGRRLPAREQVYHVVLHSKVLTAG